MVDEQGHLRVGWWPGNKAAEGEELSLEDSFNLYQEGMELVKCCNRTINDVEKKVLALDENGESHEF